MTKQTTLSSHISTNYAGQRLIDFLCNRFKYHNQTVWLDRIADASVAVNGAASYGDYVLKKNDIVSYTVVLREPPVDANIEIIHEEETFLVACKPGNLPSHADGNFIKNTFIYLLRQRMTEGGFQGPVKLVHRLDRETSGIMIVGKTDDAHRHLVRQFEAGTVDKEYCAVTRGIIHDDTFEVTGAIARDADSAISIRKKVVPAGTPGSQAAITRFEVIERLHGASLVRCRPATGRTNQIRVHLAHVGHPLVGDKLYGRTDGQFLEFVRNARAGIYEPLPWMETPRHLLHAERLTFEHPVTGERISFHCPILEDMRRYIEKLKIEV